MTVLVSSVLVKEITKAVRTVHVSTVSQRRFEILATARATFLESLIDDGDKLVDVIVEVFVDL